MTELADAPFALGAVTDPAGACEPSVQILLTPRATPYQVFLDLSAYRSGAVVLTPSGPHPLRHPTLIRFDSSSGSTPGDTGATQFTLTSWSGGPATFTVGADLVHTLSLEAPTACGPAGCAPPPR